MSKSSATTQSHGPGPFITQRIQSRPEGGLLVANSRLHRKGHSAMEAASYDEIQRIPASHARAFRHLLFPRKLGAWIALLFAIGSTHFLVGALAANWPGAFPAMLRDGEFLGKVFFSGSIFFTMAAWLQWLEAMNRDVADAFDGAPHRWRWFGWRPRNLGYLACLVQFFGTLLFNFNTADAMITGLSWRQGDALIWLPNMIGSICFLVASYLAYIEVSHGMFSFAPRSVSWWITIVNLAGSVAFQLSALESVVGPAGISAHMLFWSTLWTAVGALCFLVGAYLLIPELAEADASDG